MLIIVFIMGMFIDPIAITMICVPIYRPVITTIGIDPLWFMLLFTICTVIGYISPPFGVNLFYMKGVAPTGTKMIDIYRGILPYVALKTFVLMMSIIFPNLILFLPNYFFN